MRSLLSVPEPFHFCLKAESSLSDCFAYPGDYRRPKWRSRNRGLAADGVFAPRLPNKGGLAAGPFPSFFLIPFPYARNPPSMGGATPTSLPPTLDILDNAPP